ncbi:hypothetical protein [Moraxella lacunata]
MSCKNMSQPRLLLKLQQNITKEPCLLRAGLLSYAKFIFES